VKKEQNGRESMRRLKPTVGCNASSSSSSSSSSSNSSSSSKEEEEGGGGEGLV
jgi:hypothetical protein